MSPRHLISSLAVISSLVIPAAASAQQYDDASLLHEGFSLIMNVGPNVAFQDTLKTAGDRTISVPTAGVEASLDIGYKLQYFGTYFEIMLRSGAVLEDDKHYHCPSNSFSGNDICFSYNSVSRGDWDGYLMGAGIMIAGFIPASDRMFITIGLGALGYFGVTTDRDEGVSNFSIKLSLGLNFAVTDAIALGVAFSYEGMFDLRQSIQPAFSLIYNY